MINQSQISFSVIMPLYNKAKYVERSITSVLKQSYDHYEIVIVNDGSTDSSLEIARKYESGKVRVLDQSNRGVSSARNVGIENSSHEYLCFLDADDSWKPNFLEVLRGMINAYPDAGLYATSYQIFEYGKKTRNAMVNTNIAGEKMGILPDFFKAYTIGDSPLHMSSLCIPRRVFNDIDGFPEGERWGEDLDVFGRVAFRYPIIFSKEVCTDCRRDAEGRACNSYDRHSDWVFFKNAMDELKGNHLAERTKAELKDYLNYKRMEIVVRSVKAGNYEHAWRMLYGIDPDKLFRGKSLYFLFEKVQRKLTNFLKKA